MPWEALREVSKGMLQRQITADDQRVLLDCGLIEEKLGGLVVTRQGRLQLIRHPARL